eukprot:160594_1
MKNNELKEDVNALDVSLSPLIKCVETLPKTSEYNMFSLRWMYNPSGKLHWSPSSGTEDTYLIFKMGGVLIDSVVIKPMYTITVYTANDLNSEWELIKTTTKTIKTIIKSQHKEFIKIVIPKSEFDNNIQRITNLQWNGFEPVVKDEVTNQIKIFQNSETQIPHKIESIFKMNSLFTWMHNGGRTCFITFDCGTKQIDRIFIQFAPRSKPAVVKIRLRDVPNKYSFKTGDFQKYELETCPFKESRKWNNTVLEEELTLTNLYKNGFKRYLQIEFMNYMIEKMKIMCVKFFGHESTQIPDDSEQFDPVLDIDEKKTDSNDDEKTIADIEQKQKEIETRYKPIIIDHTPSFPNYEVENIWTEGTNLLWKPAFSYDMPFLMIDLGNNNVDRIVVKPYHKYTPRQCAIHTGDTIPQVQMKFYRYADSRGRINNALCVEKDVRNKVHQGCIFEVAGKHLKYVVLSFDGFDGTKKEEFTVSEVIIDGQSPFLKRDETKEITWEDMNGMDDNKIDQELVEKFRVQELNKQEINELLNLSIMNEKRRIIVLNLRMRRRNAAVTKITDEWWDMKKAAIKIVSENFISNRKIEAKLTKTLFEEKQMLQICQLQKQIFDEYEPKLIKKMVEREEFLLYNHESREKWWTVLTERNEKLKAMQVDVSKESVYELWKESVEHHPLQISDKYNVMEYDAMFPYAEVNKKEEMKLLWGKLADLMDESLAQKKQLLHKYHVFTLSQNYDKARSKYYGRPSVYILFDANENKFDRVEFEILKNSYFDTIKVYTADILQEQKKK